MGVVSKAEDTKVKREGRALGWAHGGDFLKLFATEGVRITKNLDFAGR